MWFRGWLSASAYTIAYARAKWKCRQNHDHIHAMRCFRFLFLFVSHSPSKCKQFFFLHYCCYSSLFRLVSAFIVWPLLYEWTRTSSCRRSIKWSQFRPIICFIVLNCTQWWFTHCRLHNNTFSFIDSAIVCRMQMRIVERTERTERRKENATAN